MTKPLLSAVALTLFPEMFPGPLDFSLAGKALEKGIWSLTALQIRDFATDKHKTVDDSPYGGGTGMVMKPDVIDAAVEAAKMSLRGAAGDEAIQPSGEAGLLRCARNDDPCIVYFTPRGVPMTQNLANNLINKDLILLCGRFEGVDQRVIEHHQMLEVSLGDFVLSGGEIAALALLDACVRLLPGVIGKESALSEESFSLGFRGPGGPPAMSGAPCENQQIFARATKNYTRLLEYPHYTRPPAWKGRQVPDVLLSGNHEHISAWRRAQAKMITAARRPDLLKRNDDDEYAAED